MQEQALDGRKHVKSFIYDFSVHGGAIGDITLDGYLPDNAVITSGMIEAIAAGTSGGSATVALKLVASEDVLAATAIASFSLAALLDVVPVGTAATAIKTTAAAGTQMVMTIATAALTAGKFVITLEYYVTI